MAINWRPGPAREPWPEDNYLECGRYVVCVQVCNSARTRTWWELSIVTLNEDGGVDAEDGCSWGWDWSDVEFWCPERECFPSEAPTLDVPQTR